MYSFDSCHRALYCLDILEAVLANLDPHDRKDRATCAQVALVCRRFSETASRSTWRVLPTFDPLWNIFLPVNVNRGNFNNPALAIRTHRISYSKWKAAQYDTVRTRAMEMAGARNAYLTMCGLCYRRLSHSNGTPTPVFGRGFSCMRGLSARSCG